MDYSLQVTAELYDLPVRDGHIEWMFFDEKAFTWNSQIAQLDRYYQQTYCRWVANAQGVTFYTHGFTESIFDTFRYMYWDFCNKIARTPNAKELRVLPPEPAHPIRFIPLVSGSDFIYLDTAMHDLFNPPQLSK